MRKIKKALFLSLLLQSAIAFNAAGQISISPEVGLSSFPLRWNDTKSGNDVNFLLGISGTVPIQKLWYANARISYTPRNNFVWEAHGSFPPATLRMEYIHSDLNIDFSINRKLFDWFHIGIGPSVIRKINTVLLSTYTFEDGSEGYALRSREDGFHYGFNLIFGVEFKGIMLKLEYYRQLKEENQRSFVGSNRYNAVIGYPLNVSNR